MPGTEIDAFPADWRGRLQLLVLQPTPFCNLDCSYCYLPNRSDKSRMSMETLARVVDSVVAGGWAGSELSVVWHAGEPLVLGTDWYDEAIAMVEQRLPEGLRVRHQFQTNAVLVSDAWCELIARHDIKVGVSIDGPAFLHDARRKTRDGRGTHAKVLRGIQLLREKGIRYHAICVLTRESLRHPDAIFAFFATLGVSQVGFNIEEVEADNAASTLAAAGVEAEYRTFFRRILELQKEAPEFLRIREIEKVFEALRSPGFGRLARNPQNDPGRIVSVGWDGAFTTWSPELLGGSHPTLGTFSLGSFGAPESPRVSLTPGGPLAAAGKLTDASRVHLARLQDEIDRGITECKKGCAYFDFCLGGAPANKLGEHGRFDVTETMFCRLTEKTLIEVVLEELDAKLPPRT